MDLSSTSIGPSSPSKGAAISAPLRSPIALSAPDLLHLGYSRIAAPPAPGKELPASPPSPARTSPTRAAAATRRPRRLRAPLVPSRRNCAIPP
nr:unnamed protein product [Digitaria exilis]